MGGTLFLLLAASAACSLISVQSVTLPSRDIRLRDVVRGACLSGRAAAIGNPIIASIPARRRNIDVPRSVLAALARRRLAMLDRVGLSGEHAIHFRVEAVSRPNASPCFSATHAVEQGHAFSRDDLNVVACATSREAPPIYYERAQRVARAAAAIPAGAYLGRLSVPAHRFPDAGDSLLLSAAIGPVRVERPVTAVQPAPGGRALFVRDGEGDVFAAPLLSPHQPEPAP